jgi:hypothetical protein
MARYRNNAGVVVNIDEDRAARIPGLTPVDDKPKKAASTTSSTPKKAPAKKATPKSGS